MADYISSHSGAEIDAAASSVPNKVDKVTGKGLSTNDFTDTLKTLLELKKVKDVTTDAINNKLVVTYTDDTTSELSISDIITDVNVTGASLDATTNVLTLTSDDGGADVTVNLSDFVNSPELATALAPINTSILEINQKAIDTNEPTGFLREFPLTMGVIELSPDGTKIISVNWNGVTSIRNDGLFYDGSTATARQFAIHPVKIADGGDGSYYVYVEGTKHQISVTQKITFDNTTGLKFVYHDLDGTLGVANQFNFDYFEDRPITCTVYGNAVNQELVNFGDERHGIQMDGFTHRYLHFTQGTQYISGMEIQGLVAGGTTYTQVTSGFAYDEDIYMNPPQQTNAPHLWIDGTSWRVVNDTNVVGHLVTGVAQYNLNTVGIYSLAPVTGNDAMIVFFVLTNNREFPYVKILGQKVYADTNAARADMENALSDLTLAGLPSPEFLPIGAVIIRSTGAIQTLSDGSLYYDLRKVKFTGSGSVSGTSQYHADLLGRDVADSHPIGAVTNLQNTLDGKVSKVTSTDNSIVRFDGTTGNVQDSAVTINDLGYLGVGTSSPSGILDVQGGITTDATATSIVIKAQNAGGTAGSYKGGNINISAGNSFAVTGGKAGGSINITAGKAEGSGIGVVGGGITILGGAGGAIQGGSVSITGGAGGTAGNGGTTGIRGGTATEGLGGNLSLMGGISGSTTGVARNGSGVYIQGGSAVSGGTQGIVDIKGGGDTSNGFGVIHLNSSGGNVGIGTTTPNSQLSVNNNPDYIIDITKAGVPLATPSETGGNIGAGTYYYVITASSNTLGGSTIQSAQSLGATITGTTGSITLSWAAVPIAVSYSIYRTTVSGTYASPSLVVSGITTNTFTDTALTLNFGIPMSPDAQFGYGKASHISHFLNPTNSKEANSFVFDSVVAGTGAAGAVINGLTASLRIPANYTNSVTTTNAFKIEAINAGSGTSNNTQGLLVFATNSNTSATPGSVYGSLINSRVMGAGTATVNSAYGTSTQASNNSSHPITNMYALQAGASNGVTVASPNGGAVANMYGASISAGDSTPNANTAIYGIKSTVTKSSTGTAGAIYGSHTSVGNTTSGAVSNIIGSGIFITNSANTDAGVIAGIDLYVDNSTATSNADDVSGIRIGMYNSGIINNSRYGLQIISDVGSNITGLDYGIHQQGADRNYFGSYTIFNDEVELTTASAGVILKSPNGTRYKITVADDGTLTTTAL